MATEHAENLNYIHCVFQELEGMGIELPMGDYDMVYKMLEEARDGSPEECNTCGGTGEWETTTEDSPDELVSLGPCPDC